MKTGVSCSTALSHASKIIPQHTENFKEQELTRKTATGVVVQHSGHLRLPSLGNIHCESLSRCERCVRMC